MGFCVKIFLKKGFYTDYNNFGFIKSTIKEDKKGFYFAAIL
jgi:hypothetical protein